MTYVHKEQYCNSTERCCLHTYNHPPNTQQGKHNHPSTNNTPSTLLAMPQKTGGPRRGLDQQLGRLLWMNMCLHCHMVQLRHPIDYGPLDQGHSLMPRHSVVQDALPAANSERFSRCSASSALA